MAAVNLRNRLLVATAMWRQTTNEPLPQMPPGDPAEQIESFELQLVEFMCKEATRETAREIAAQTWELVHDRPESDPVKRKVVACHEALARLGRESG
jgi:hypothetical protein